MAIKDFFKKKKQAEEVKPALKTKKQDQLKKAEPGLVKKEKIKKADSVKKEQPAVKKEKKQIAIDSYQILKGPHVTEKAGDLTEKNKYVFKVFKKASKTEIKKAIQAVYGVDVVSVRIINVFKKKRRVGKVKGFRSGYKKAIVKIKSGQKIEVLPR
jgi:large subunit ribosomal protein L23